MDGDDLFKILIAMIWLLFPLLTRLLRGKRQPQAPKQPAPSGTPQEQPARVQRGRPGYKEALRTIFGDEVMDATVRTGEESEWNALPEEVVVEEVDETEPPQAPPREMRKPFFEIPDRPPPRLAAEPSVAAKRQAVREAIVLREMLNPLRGR